MSALRILSCAALALALSGCSILVASELDGKGGGTDGGPRPDSPGTDDGGGDGGDVDPDGDVVEVDCTDMADGTACGTGLLCIAGACVPTSCGDGYVDSAAGEECEDGNDQSQDGCEPTSCTYSCESAAECADMRVCNGDETCNTATHTCEAGAAAPGGTPCVLDDGSAGICNGGLCAPAGCGNGVMESGEECDDGANGNNADGCRDDCQYTCETDDDCSDADMCTGTETCDVALHRCVPGTPLVCDDGSPCTTDTCAALTGCASVLIDADGDGRAPAAVCTGAMGGDCDDMNNTRYPGAVEYCDMLDNDCDGTADEGAVMATCYRDADGDRYPLMSVMMTACTCPSGYITARTDMKWDCFEGAMGGSAVHPDQTTYFDSGYCTNRLGCTSTTTPYSFDYDCDGVETKRWTRTGWSACPTSTLSCSSGWTGSTAPACGASATLRQCGLLRTTDGVYYCGQTALGTVRQQCR